MRTVLQILFRISPLNDKKGNPKNLDLDFLILKFTLRTDFSEVKSVFGFPIRLGNLDFPIERTLRPTVRASLLVALELGTYKQLKHILTHSLLEISPKNAF